MVLWLNYGHNYGILSNNQGESIDKQNTKVRVKEKLTSRDDANDQLGLPLFVVCIPLLQGQTYLHNLIQQYNHANKQLKRIVPRFIAHFYGIFLSKDIIK